MFVDDNEYLDMDYHVGKEYGAYKIRSVAKEKSKDGHKLYVGVCQVCGFEKVAKLSDFKASSANRCTHQDSFAKMTDVQFEAWYEENKRICLNCHRPILLKKTDKKSDYLIRKFCGKSCAASYNNRGGSLINPEDVQNLGQDYWNEVKNSDDIDYPVGKTYGIFKILSREPERDPKYNKVLYRCVCLDCGIEKVAPLHKIKEYVDHCTHVGKLSELPKERFEIWYERNKVQCKKCGKDIPAEEYDTKSKYLKKKLCKDCFHHTKGRFNKNSGTQSKKNKFYCETCGKELDTKRRFCDKECQSELNFRNYIEKWKSGLVDGLTGESQVSKHIKKYLMRSNNFKCQICGWGAVNPYSGQIPLEVHHINGDYKDNNKNNLSLLCPCCHSLTPTYRALNYGNGRENRRTTDHFEDGEPDDEYIGQTFGIYKIISNSKNKRGDFVYTGICVECGYERIAPIDKFKKIISNCRHVAKHKRNRHYLSNLPKEKFDSWYEANKKRCLNCDEFIPVSKTDNASGYKHKTFCSGTCHNEFEYKNYINRWKRGLENGIVGKDSLSKRIKRYLLEKAEYKCPVCGWCEVNPYTGKIPLEIHHVDGDYTNNVEENLAVLCPNCHSLTPNYKSANKGKGRGSKDDNLTDMGD